MANWLLVGYLNLLALLRLSSRVRLVHHPEPAELCSTGNSTAEKRTTNLAQILERCPSLSGKLAFFTPTFWLLSGHMSTIYCTLASFDYDEVEYTRHYLRVPDGGTIGVDFTPPISQDNPLDDRPLLVVSHGLSGGSYESYVRNVFARLPHGWRGVCINSRGCANIPLTSAKMFSGSETDDLRCALVYLSRAAPDAPLYGLGFSLGAGRLALLAGEDGEQCPLKTVVPVSAPWDYLLGHIKLTSSWLRLVYSKAMAGNMRALVHKHRKQLAPVLDMDALFHNPNQTLFEFDSLGTTKLTEKRYNSAYDYYRDASPTRVVDGVRIPLLSLCAMDDPITASAGEPRDATETNPYLVFASVTHGGHLGYFQNAFRPRRWIAGPVIEWLTAVHEANAAPRAPYETTSPRVAGQRKPQIGDDLVLMKGREDRVGFKLVAEAEVLAWVDEDTTKTALTQGL